MHHCTEDQAMRLLQTTKALKQVFYAFETKLRRNHIRGNWEKSVIFNYFYAHNLFNIYPFYKFENSMQIISRYCKNKAIWDYIDKKVYSTYRRQIRWKS